jgi:hypothetical protein
MTWKVLVPAAALALAVSAAAAGDPAVYREMLTGYPPEG